MKWDATVLVVEDDTDQREQLAGFLAGLGLDVRHAGDVNTARSVLDAGGVDVVVSDLRMPGEGSTLR